MSEALPLLPDAHSELARSDRSAYFEQRLFVLSPLGIAGTSAVLFALFFGLYAVAAWAGGRAPFAAGFAGDTRIALALSLLMTTILAMQRFIRVRERAEVNAYARVLKGGLAGAMDYTKLTPPNARLGSVTLVAASIGAGLDYLFFFSRGAGRAWPEALWFAALTLLLILAFARGVALTRASTRRVAEVIDHDLLIDLLRIEDQGVWGRGAARFALIWFTVCAMVLLLFIQSVLTGFTVAALAACAAMGIWVFFAQMMRIHGRIRAAKAEEIERIRTRMDGLRRDPGESGDAAQRLQGLIAYEARIAAVPEWPYDQTTLMRVAASALVLGLPWFGQAVAQYLVDHFVH